MDSPEFPDCYDKDVALFLCGINLTKLVDTFSQQAIDFETFMLLTDEDLCFMGVTDVEDRNELLRGISSFRSRKVIKNFPEQLQLTDRDVLAIASNTLKHLTLLNASLAYTRLRLKATPVRNIIYGKHSAASVLSELTEEAMSQNAVIKSRLLGMEKSGCVEVNPTRYAVKRRLAWTFFTLSAVITVAGVTTLHIMRRS